MPVAISAAIHLGLDQRGGGASPFVPSDMTSQTCVQWLRGYQISEHWLDAARTNASDGSDGNTIRGWTDASGTGNHASNSVSAGTSPKYYSAIQNGLGAILYDGADDNHRCNGVSSAFTGNDKAFTIALVIKPASNTGIDTYFSAGHSAVQAWWRTYTNGTTYQHSKQDDSAAGAVVVGPSGTADTNAHVLVHRHNGTTVDTWLDGTQTGTAQAQNVGVTTLDGAAIGAFLYGGTFAGGQYAHVYIGEIIVWNGALSNGDITLANTGLRARWNI